jgi:superfamily II DNA helicase RecQ
VLDVRLDYSFRNFDGFHSFFAKLTQANVMSPVVFLTATLMEPATVLLACGLPVLFDEAFYMSPMRKNLSFKLTFLNDGTTSATSHRLIMQNSVAAIKQHAPHQRVLIFVMFKWELELVATWLRQSFPGNLSCGCLP